MMIGRRGGEGGREDIFTDASTINRCSYRPGVDGSLQLGGEAPEIITPTDELPSPVGALDPADRRRGVCGAPRVGHGAPTFGRKEPLPILCLCWSRDDTEERESGNQREREPTKGVNGERERPPGRDG